MPKFVNSKRHSEKKTFKFRWPPIASTQFVVFNTSILLYYKASKTSRFPMMLTTVMYHVITVM